MGVTGAGENGYLRAFACGPIRREETATELAFVCGLVAGLGPGKVWFSYMTRTGASKHGKIDARRLPGRISSAVRHGFHIPGC